MAGRRSKKHLTPDARQGSEKTPGGAFFRVMHKQVRDMHAALNEVGILYLTLMVHNGWDEPGPLTERYRYADGGNIRELELPIIQRKGRANGGHAVAIVGYTARGFIIQNSWGPDWGGAGSRCFRTRTICCTRPTSGWRSSASGRSSICG